MKTLELVPYHQFQFRGNKYVFDIESSAVMRIDDAAYDALSLRRNGDSVDDNTSKLAAAYGQETADAVLAELDWLEQNGLFRRPATTYDDAENEAYIQRLIRMSTNKIELSLAEACNLRCRYCYVADNDALNNGLMPWKIAKQGVDLVFERSGNARDINITFFGGEPLLNKRVLLRTIRYSQKKGAEQGKQVRYSMTTNATLLDDEIIDVIKRYNFGLMVSLDGPKEVQDQMRPFVDGRGSYDETVVKIKQLMQRRRSVTVRCTLSNQHLDRKEIVGFLEDFGFSRVGMSRCSGRADSQGPYDIGRDENAVLKQQDDFFLDRLLAQLQQGERIRFNPWASAVRNIHDKANRRMRCGVGRGTTTVGIDGKLYPCHRYVGMENYVLGHVSTGINREQFADYLRAYFRTKRKCESCWAINICGGYCPWYVSCDDGTCQEPSDWWCEEVKGWYEQGIWLYDTLRSQHPQYFRQLVGDPNAPLPSTDDLQTEPFLR